LQRNTEEAIDAVFAEFHIVLACFFLFGRFWAFQGVFLFFVFRILMIKNSESDLYRLIDKMLEELELMLYFNIPAEYKWRIREIFQRTESLSRKICSISFHTHKLNFFNVV
jgi:hypothetical protein